MWADTIDFLNSALSGSPLASGLWLALVGYLVLLLLLALVLTLLMIRLHRRNEASARRWNRLEAAWSPELAQVLIGAWPAEHLLQQIRPADGLLFVDFLTRSAKHKSGTARQKLRELAEPWLPGLAARSEDGDDEQRARAILTLSTLAPDNYRPQLAHALNDPVPMVAMLAARALAERGAGEYLETLLKRLDRFKSWSQRSLIAMLVQFAQTDTAPLCRALGEAAYPNWVKALVLRALCELGADEALPLAVKLLESNQDPELQAAALDLLGAHGQAWHQSLIREHCRSAEFVTRLHAHKALTRLGDASDEALFRQSFDDPSQWIALQAAYGLQAIGCQDALAVLAESDHPRAELAQQVLAEQGEGTYLLIASQSAGFVARVPAWLQDVTLHPSLRAWHAVQQVLFQAGTHPEVRLAIADALGPEAAAAMYQPVLRRIEARQDSEPAYLYRALHRLNPLAANQRLRQDFYALASDAARLEILDLLLQHHTPANAHFVEVLASRLDANPMDFPDALLRECWLRLEAFGPALAV